MHHRLNHVRLLAVAAAMAAMAVAPAAAQQNTPTPSPQDRPAMQAPEQQRGMGERMGDRMGRGGQAMLDRSPEEIRQAVQNRIERQLGPMSGLNLSLNNGTLTLEGTVANYFQRYRAEEIASNVRGIRRVDNQISVQKTDVADEQIQQNVQQRLEQGFATADIDSLRVEVNDGAVVLHGQVDTTRQKQAAEEAILGVRGIQQVNNEITVADAQQQGQPADTAARERFYILIGRVTTPEATALTGSERDELEEYLQDVFSRNPYLDDADVDVSLGENNALELTGDVDSYAAAQYAERLLSQLGFTNIQNNIEIHADEAGTSPEDTAENIEEALSDDVVLTDADINPRMEGRTLVLDGTVISQYQKDYAENRVATRSGVTSVRNNLQVTRQGQPSTDEGIREAIESQFFWSLDVDGGDIQIAAQNGEVTLTGEVDSIDEFNAATENAYEGGAKKVINQTVIRPQFPGSALWRDREWWGEDTTTYGQRGMRGDGRGMTREQDREGMQRSVAPNGAVSESGTGSVDTGRYTQPDAAPRPDNTRRQDMRQQQ